MTNTPRNKAKVTNERRIYLDILAETIKGFKGLTLEPTINNSAYYHSEKNDAKSDPKSDPFVATHTSDGKRRKVTDTDTNNRNYPHKLLINRLITDIIPVVILSINQTTTDGVAASGGTLHAVRMILLKETVTDAAHSAAHIFKDPPVVNWKETDGIIPWGGNCLETPPDQLPQFGLVMETWYLQLGWGANILAAQGCPSILRKSGTPNHLTLPLMDFCQTLRPCTNLE